MIKESRINHDSKVSLIFVHGIMGTYRHFSFLYPLIDKRFSYYAFELKGHDADYRAFKNARYQEWEDEVMSLAEFLHNEGQRVVFVTHSMGGLFALLFAKRHPNEASLFLLNPPLYGNIKPIAFKRYGDAIYGDEQIDEKSKRLIVATDMELTKNPFAYLTWLPNMFSLYKAMRKERAFFNEIKVKPSVVFHSAEDELLAKRNVTSFKSHKDMKNIVLMKSTHFGFDESDKEIIKKEFIEFQKNL